MLTIFVHGGVEAIDTEADTITIWLSGFVGYRIVPITGDMPLWMRCPGATFHAEIPEENCRRRDLDGVAWMNVEPNLYAHLDEDEILEELCRVFAHLDPFTERMACSHYVNTAMQLPSVCAGPAITKLRDTIIAE